MKVDMKLGGADDLTQHHVGEDLGNGSIRPPWGDLVEVEPIEWRCEAGAALEHSHVRNRHGNDGAAQLRWFDRVDQSHDGFDGRVLRRMDTGREA